LKDQSRRPVTRRREREKKMERDWKRREGGLGTAEAGRAEGQAEMKAEQERKPDTQDMLEEHRSCRLIKSNQDRWERYPSRSKRERHDSFKERVKSKLVL
jgi:hypothetical protein